MFKISEQRKQTHEKPHKHKNDFCFSTIATVLSHSVSFLIIYVLERKVTMTAAEEIWNRLTEVGMG